MADLTVIGIGSSAGGLEAIRELVATLPSDLPVAYVVAQHMSPHHKSLMTELVGYQTSLTVKDVVDDTAPEPGTIYFATPSNDVTIEDGRLRLNKPSPNLSSPKPSVNRLFMSLAREYADNAVGVILSGTGSDGAYGIKSIREAGGITVAQDSESAKYDGMPVAAIQTGCVDLVLSPSDIGTHLKKILTSPRDFGPIRKDAGAHTINSDLLQILLARTRVDFRDYKQSTITRRIERRMVALGLEDHEQYAQLCRNNPQAADDLFKDLLISVTWFFRDKEEFRVLENVLPDLLQNSEHEPVRIWVAACSTGEEAYSVAMLVAEAIDAPLASLRHRVQIFATDIDTDALAAARKGFYGKEALEHIPKHLANKYLVQQNDGVRIVDGLRSLILFSEHNVCQDPPFQKIDLLCCRNLMIYFGTSLQKKVLSRFHYSLAHKGLLFLGTAETTAAADEHFVQDFRSAHVYRKRLLNREDFGARPKSSMRISKLPEHRASRDNGQNAERLMLEALATTLGKNSLLVRDDLSIVRVFGDISPYIEVAERTNLKMHVDLLRSPLRETARSLISIALRTGEIKTGLRHPHPAKPDTEVRLDVYPMTARQINESAALITIKEVEPNQKSDQKSKDFATDDKAAANRIRDLETDLSVTRESLQQTIEELETSNEELQSLNEELQSTNEELQAANEELETSNEELQATNEELITVNEELTVTASELSERSGELSSVLRNSPLSILVTDNALQVVQATTAALDMFNLSAPPTKPHISQCDLPAGYPPLAKLANETLRLGYATVHEFVSGEFQTKLNCTPYFDTRGQILGVVLTVAETSGLAREMEMVLSHSKLFLVSRTVDGGILRISETAAKLLGTERDTARGQNFYDLLTPESGALMQDLDQTMLKHGAKTIHETIELQTVSGRTVAGHFNLFPYQTSADEEVQVYSIASLDPDN